MSISNRHSIQKFISGKSTAMQGQRLAKIGYKGKDKFSESMFASVPVLQAALQEEIIENPSKFFGILQEVMEKAQDDVIKSLWESSGAQLQSVSDEDISIETCLAFLESSIGGGRLTKEALKDWFSSDMEVNLGVVIAEKLGKDLEDTKVIQVLAGYKGMFMECAAPKISLKEAQIKALKEALTFSASDDGITRKLLSRFEALEKEAEKEAEVVLLALS